MQKMVFQFLSWLHIILKGSANRFKDYPNFSDIWMKNGKTLIKGEIFKNKKLANTYKKIASTYGRDFYEGGIAKHIVNLFNLKVVYLKRAI